MPTTRNAKKTKSATSTRQVDVAVNSTKHQIPVESIQPRLSTATRELSAVHVLELAESIAALGLIEPLAVDMHFRLLAGGHRWVALRLLATDEKTRTELWCSVFGSSPAPFIRKRLKALKQATDGVAVHVLPVDSASDPAKALALEIAENERRRNYTKEEILGLAEKLRAAGYRDSMGRPKQGERTLVPVLSAVLGKARRTVFKILADAKNAGNCKMPVAADENKRVANALQRWLQICDVQPSTRALAEALLLSIKESPIQARKEP